MSDRPETPLLDTVHGPADLKRFSDAELVRLAHELRARHPVSGYAEPRAQRGAD